jgi:hypothetical protein
MGLALAVLAVFLAAGGLQAQEKLQRKSGLWELKRTSTVTRGKTRVYQMCVDQASDNALSPLAEGSPGEICQIGKLQREADKMSVDATCSIPQTSVVATTHALISGKFDTAYKVESKTTFAPPLRGNQGGTAVLEARWTGPCKPDQHPGDVIGPRGGKFNIADQKPHDEKAGARTKTKTGRKGGYAPATQPSAPGPAPTPAVPPPGSRTN